MTNKELRLKIAEALSPKGCTSIHIAEGIGQGNLLCWWRNEQMIDEIPNYPEDVAAALGLLIKKVYYEINEEEVTIHIPDTSLIIMQHDGTLEGIARAICEAYLEAALEEKSRG